MTGNDHSSAPVRAPDPTPGTSRPRLRWPITLFLGLCFGTLMLVAVASVLFLGVVAARDNTATLLRDKADLTLASIIDRVRSHLNPVEAQVDYLADALARGEFDHRDEESMRQFFAGALAGTPQVAVIAFAQPEGAVWRVERGSARLQIESWVDDPEAADAIAEARAASGASWSPPLWSPALGRAILSHRVPVHGPDGFLGVLVAAIALDDLSRYVATLSGGGLNQTAFILHDFQRVLAHPGHMEALGEESEAAPMPWLDEVGDAVLANIWDPDRAPLRFLAPLSIGQGHMVRVDGAEQVYIYSHLRLDGQRPWLVGMHFPASVAAEEILRLRNLVIGGVLLLVTFVAATFAIGRWLSTPVMRLAVAAESIRQLDLSTVQRLRSSRIREIDDAARAFNSMVVGLRWFETYLPRKLVSRLIAGGEFRQPPSEERLVTVMFTDIVGFSSFTAESPAHEVAAFLNRHFTLIGQCIESHDGTIDKYIGDGMMAFWGAPGDQPDQALRACRAALEIVTAVDAENAIEAEGGGELVRVRIGIHTGRAIVGNIGSSGRLNYTLVGNAVNIAQRLEELGKVIGGGETVVLISEATAQALPADIPVEDQGMWPLRGRGEKARVFRLTDAGRPRQETGAEPSAAK